MPSEMPTTLTSTSPPVVLCEWVDAREDKVVATLMDGSTVSRHSLPRPLNLLFTLQEGLSADALVIELVRHEDGYRHLTVEKSEPFLLCGDRRGNYMRCIPDLIAGNYTLTLSSTSPTPFGQVLDFQLM